LGHRIQHAQHSFADFRTSPIPFYSKTQAERKAWKIAHSPDTDWTLHGGLESGPDCGAGPALAPQFGIVQKTLQKLVGFHFSIFTGCPSFDMPLVDVRDAVVAHVKAAGLVTLSSN